MLHENNFGVLTPAQADPIAKVFESSKRLISLTDELLDISRAETGKMVFDFETVQLETIVQSVCEELGFNALKRGIKVSFEPLAKKLSAIKVDEPKIRQVIQNLIDNSVKYTPDNGWVKVQVAQIGKKIRVVVSDNGKGISPEDLPKLFAKFSRGTDMHKDHPEGSGLGLYVAKMMVEAHNGRIWAESEGVGKGARFCFEVGV